MECMESLIESHGMLYCHVWINVELQSAPVYSTTGNSANLLNSTISLDTPHWLPILKSNSKFDPHQIWPKVFGHINV